MHGQLPRMGSVLPVVSRLQLTPVHGEVRLMSVSMRETFCGPLQVVPLEHLPSSELPNLALGLWVKLRSLAPYAWQVGGTLLVGLRVSFWGSRGAEFRVFRFSGFLLSCQMSAVSVE
jgi:hypothetical protein